MGRRVLLLALLAAALAWPGSAFAADGSLVNGVMNYTAAAGETNSVLFTLETSGAEPTYRIVDAPAVSITAQSPCFNAGPANTMECPVDGNGSGAITILTASLGDDADSITLEADLPTSIGAGAGADVMNGGPASDFLRGGQGSDIIDGFNGDDQLIGDDPNVDTGGDDALSGGGGNDSIDGQAGSDNVRGGQGNDTLNGSDGNDTFPSEANTDGNDVVSGGAGIDTATYAARSQGQQLSLDDVANDGFIGNAADNLLSDVENLVGSSGGDQMSGSGSANQLDGGGGDDALSGLGGDDALNGGDGNDNAQGGDGADVVNAGAGNDSALGGDGADTLNGDAGDDGLDGGPGADALNGGDGVDTGDYSSRSAAVAVTLDGNPGDGELGENDDVGVDVENLRGGAGDDTFLGNDSNNAFDGGAGEDYQDGGGGADALTGGDSGDVLRSRGGSGPAAISCGPGPDFVIAKAGDTASPDCDRVDNGVNQRPRLRDSAVVAPAGGSLQMSPTGIVRRVPLQDRVVLPLRSLVDTVAGSVKVTSAATASRRQTIALEDGLFNITQTAARRAVTQFALQGGDFTVCPVARRRTTARSSAKPKTIRVLWAKGKGRFRTKGRYAAAAIRGTRWQTVDRCDGTLIRVTQGSVSVRDLVAKRTVIVKAGDSYLARAAGAARRRR